MSVTTNKDLAQKVLAVFNSRDLAGLDELYAPDYVHHDPSLPPDVQRGLSNYKQGVAMFYSAFPDLTGTIEDIIAEGDRVAMRLTWRGTHRGPLMGIPASGKSAEFSMMQIVRLADNRVVEGWVNFDALGMMTQIGAIPSPVG